MVQVQNIDKICRENLNTYPFEYIVIENFITGLDNKNIFDNYIKLQENLSQKEFNNDGPKMFVSYHNSTASGAGGIDDFIADCEKEAAKLEITVDYYLAEFV